MKSFKDAKRIVIKVGSSSLTYETGMLNIRMFERLCKLLADVRNSGREIILVSSGAIPVGMSKLGLKARPQTLPEKQAAAAVGQCELMYMYDKQLKEYHHKVAQVLLTRDVVEQSIRKELVQNTFESLLGMGAMPIVNENDTVAVEEIEFGDNDTLSAIVASLTHADGLVILSDIDGLFEKDPAQYPGARLIEHVSEIDEHIEEIAGGVGSNRGTGGMVTKIAAAKICFENDCAMAILNSANMEKLYDLLDGESVGTVFMKEGI